MDNAEVSLDELCYILLSYKNLVIQRNHIPCSSVRSEEIQYNSHLVLVGEHSHDVTLTSLTYPYPAFLS